MLSYKRPLLVLIILLYYFVSAEAQRKDLIFQVINNEIGLPQNSVYDFVQDSIGFIWIGTQDGLARFDGHEIFVISKYNDKYSNLSSNEINCLYHKWPYIFIGTIDGLSSYNILTDSIISYSTKSNRNLYVNEIIYDSLSKKIIVGTKTGLFSLNELNDRELEQIECFSENHNINDLESSINGRIILATDIGLHSLSIENNTLDTLTNWEIKKIVKRSDGTIYLLKKNKIYFFNGSFDKINEYKYYDGDDLLLINDFCFFNDEILLATQNNGIIYKKNKNLNFGEWTKSIPENKILTVFIDDNNNLWAGTDTKGACINTSNSRVFKHYSFAPNYPDNLMFLPENIVWAIEEVDSLRVAVGLDSKGIVIFNKHHNTFTPLDAKIANLNNCSVKSIVRINTTLWIGNSSGEVYCTETDNLANTYKYLSFGSNEEIKAIIGLPGDNVAIGSNYNLYIVNTVSGIIDTLNIQNVYSLLIDKNSQILYVGTKGHGLFKVDLHNYSVKFLSKFAESILSIVNTTIDKSTLLIGTKGLGILEYIIDSNSFIAYSKTLNLPEDVIHSIVQVNDTDYWFSTNNGIFNLDYYRDRVYHISGFSSIQNKEFCGGSSLVDSKENVYFGGINGFNIFKPDKIKEIRESNRKYSLFISDFQINSQDPTIRSNFKLDSNVVLKNYFNIAYQESPASFRVNTIDYCNNELIYEANLIGGNGDTNLLTPINNNDLFNIDFTVRQNLKLIYSSDIYKLLIKVKSKYGYVDINEERSYLIEVNRAPYYIYGIGVLLLLLLLFVKLGLNIRKVYLNNKKFRKYEYSSKHRENINEITRLNNKDELFDVSFEALLDTYQYSSIGFMEFNYSNNEFNDINIKGQDEKLVGFFNLLIEQKRIKIEIDSDGETLLVVNDKAIIKSYYIIKNVLIFPIFLNNNLRGKKGLRLMSPGLIGIYLCRIGNNHDFTLIDGIKSLSQFLFVKKMGESLVYLDNIKQTLHRIYELNNYNEIRNIVLTKSQQVSNHIDFIDEIVKYAKDYSVLIHGINVDVICLGLSGGQEKKRVNADNEEKPNYLITEVKLNYQGSLVMIVSVFSIEKVPRVISSYLEFLFNISLEYYFLKKVDYFIKKLIIPFPLFENRKGKNQNSISRGSDVMKPFFNLIKDYFGSDFISFWIKDINKVSNEIEYFQRYGTKEMINACKSFGTNVVKINKKRKYIPYPISTNQLSDENKEFYDFATKNGFKSVIYVPLIISDHEHNQIQQYGYILIYSVRVLNKDLLNIDHEFLKHLSEKGARFIQNKKMTQLAQLVEHTKSKNLKDALKRLLLEAESCLFPDFVILFWYKKQTDPSQNYTNYEKDFVHYGEGNLDKDEVLNVLQSNTNFKNELIDSYIKKTDDIIWVNSINDYDLVFGKKQIKLEKSNHFKDWFFYRQKIKSLVAAPLIMDGEKVGVIFINFKTQYFYRNTDNEYMVRSYINLVEEEFEKANYYNLLKQQKEIAELKAELERKKKEKIQLEFKDIEDKLNEVLPRATTRSFYLLLQGINHDIRSLMSDLNGLSEDSYTEVIRNKMKPDYNILENNLKEFQRLTILNIEKTESLLELFQFDQDEEKIDIVDIVSQVVTFFKVDKKHFRKDSYISYEIISHDQIPPLRCLKTEFAMIIYNIIKNAKDALLSDLSIKNKKVTIMIEFLNKNYHIKVVDNGPGISSDKKKLIFNWKYTTKGKKGLGIGLYFVKTVLESSFSANINVISTEDKFTTFDIKIPDYINYYKK